MPHKHTRKREANHATINLSPSQVARPLPVSKSARVNGIFTSVESRNQYQKRKQKQKRTGKSKDHVDDDTPKGFLRLMALQQGKRVRKGLDDGMETTPSTKKRKSQKQGVQPGLKASTESESLQIHAGEKMSEFAARVDAALPVGGLITKSRRRGADITGTQVNRTRMEKRMHKMYDQWRVEEARRRDCREQDTEVAEEETMDEDGQVRWKADMPTLGAGKKSKKKTKRKRMLGEADDGEDDPWAQLRKNRKEKKIGLNDVVKAPPTFSNIPKEKFREPRILAGAYDTPKASGSLKRREELSMIRKRVVIEYRAQSNKNKNISNK